MRSVIGSAAPLMPMTGYFNSRRGPREWKEGNLENWNGYFTLRGAGEAVFPDETVRTAAGDFLLLPPALPRTYRVPDPTQGWEFYWLHFRATPRVMHTLDWFDRLRRWQIHHVSDISLRVTLAAALEEAHRLNLGSPDLPGREAILEAMLEAILLRIAAAEIQRSSPTALDTRIERAIEFFHCDIAGAGDIATLARKAGLSRSQFCLLFRRGTDRTPQQYVEERRLEMAAYYLRTTAQSVAEVAESVGFTSPFYFTNRFRRRFGRSPSEYRHSPDRHSYRLPESGARSSLTATRAAGTAARERA